MKAECFKRSVTTEFNSQHWRKPCQNKRLFKHIRRPCSLRFLTWLLTLHWHVCFLLKLESKGNKLVAVLHTITGVSRSRNTSYLINLLLACTCLHMCALTHTHMTSISWNSPSSATSTQKTLKMLVIVTTQIKAQKKNTTADLVECNFCFLEMQ